MRTLTALLKLFFHYFYHQFAWTYDAVASVVSIGRWNRWVAAVLPFIEGNEVLELGYGPGHLQALLASKGLSVTGLDESRQMAQLAGRRLRQSGHPVNRLVRGRAGALPFQAGAFDSVVATFPSEYIFQPETLEQVKRVLRDDGRFVVLPAASIIGRATHDRLAAWLFQITHQAPASTADVFSARLEGLLREAGFSADFHTLEIHSSLVFIIEARKAAPAHAE